MDKLNETFKINPLYEADGYKVGHHLMLAPNVSREAWTWIPRSLKYLHPSINQVMSGGQQLVWRYIHSHFQEFFFKKDVNTALKFGEDMSKYLMMDYNYDHFIQLHNLGYLPVEVKSLPEGTLTDPNIPHMTGINTVDGYAWLGLFLETLLSKLAWQLPTAATLGYQFKKNAIEWTKKTDKENLWLADFMAHDFHSRGGNPFTSIAVGLGHAFSNLGGDTLNVIPASRYYYDFDENEVPIYSVNASEHSVTCTGIFFYQKLLIDGKLDEKIKEYYSFPAPSEGSVEEPDYLAIAEWLNLHDWLKKFPKGILSIVSDTFDLWKLITFILPRLREEILARDGKLVIRPDSGDPVDIICGVKYTRSDEDNQFYRIEDTFETYPDGDITWTKHKVGAIPVNESEIKGVIELLWEIFGGTINSQGYKVLDSHIGAIYGDSINLDRQVSIYSRLAEKRFAATNIVVGVGSYTYVYITRDSAGYAAKGSWFETKEFFRIVKDNKGIPYDTEYTVEQYDIYKDPITDGGTKKSLKGFQFVNENFNLESGVSEEKYDSQENMLKTIYKNGEFFNQTTLTEIREKLNNSLNK